MTTTNLLNDPRLDPIQDTKLDLAKVLDVAKRTVMKSSPLADPRDGRPSDIFSYDPAPRLKTSLG